MSAYHTCPFAITLRVSLPIVLFCIIYYEDAQNREPEEFKPVHFVAMPVKDTPEDAEKAEQDVMYLVRMVRNREQCSLHFLA